MAGESFFTGNPYTGGANASPAGAHTEGHRFDAKKRFADIFTGGIYHWQKKRLPTPGAQNYAFETLGLTEFTPIGAGVRNRNAFRVLQKPQLYVNGQAYLTSGLGGIAAGQMIFQPLLDPYNGQYGGVPVDLPQ